MWCNCCSTDLEVALSVDHAETKLADGPMGKRTHYTDEDSEAVEFAPAAPKEVQVVEPKVSKPSEEAVSKRLVSRVSIRDSERMSRPSEGRGVDRKGTGYLGPKDVPLPEDDTVSQP
mmetsp:Transcript_56339/g.131289  ORF Transcript_56339/g.131289 Transcript_56339/m.131289 type:complete len:117 (+) Transcript_56339:88-438(+)